MNKDFVSTFQLIQIESKRFIKEALLRRVYVLRYWTWKLLGSSCEVLEKKINGLMFSRHAVSVWVKTEEIKQFFSPSHKARKNQFFLEGFRPGELNSMDQMYDSNMNYRAVFQLFEEKKPLREVDQYAFYADNIEKKGSHTRSGDRDEFHSLEDVNAYFDVLRSVFETVRDEGFKCQEDLGNHHERDPGVVIGEHGEIIKSNGGNHRFAIARILQIETIPVSVRAVHRNWVRDCSKRYGCDPYNAILQGIRALNVS